MREGVRMTIFTIIAVTVLVQRDISDLPDHIELVLVIFGIYALIDVGTWLMECTYRKGH